MTNQEWLARVAARAGEVEAISTEVDGYVRRARKAEVEKKVEAGRGAARAAGQALVLTPGLRELVERSRR